MVTLALEAKKIAPPNIFKFFVFLSIVVHEVIIPDKYKWKFYYWSPKYGRLMMTILPKPLHDKKNQYNSEIKISFAGSVSDSVCSLKKIPLFGSVLCSMRVNPAIFSLCPYIKYLYFIILVQCYLPIHDLLIHYPRRFTVSYLFL